MWRNWYFHPWKAGEENGTATMENRLTVPSKVKYGSTIWLSNSTSGCMYIQEKWKHVHTKTCTQTFIAVLFPVPQNGNDSNVHQRTDKTWSLYIMEHYSTIKEGRSDTCYNTDEPGKHATWKKPDAKDHILIYHIYHLYEMSRIGFRDTTYTDGCQGLEAGKDEEWLLMGTRCPFGGDEDGGEGCTDCECTKRH